MKEKGLWSANRVILIYMKKRHKVHASLSYKKNILKLWVARQYIRRSVPIISLNYQIIGSHMTPKDPLNSLLPTHPKSPLDAPFKTTTPPLPAAAVLASHKIIP